jgi:2-polyprenyl-3-methyl-5-hydroxy-6-metoxy-1,4-benzoquinol methylase
MITPDNVILEDVPCPLGCPKSDEAILTGRDLLNGLPGEFTVVKCGTCGLMRTTPRPLPETIGFYYPDDYGPYLGTVVQQTALKQTSTIKKLLKLVVKQVFKFNTNTLPPLPPGRMLEVGCASGAFLHQMAGQGWQVKGIEFSEKAAQTAAQLGYCVHTGPLETAPEPSEPFDLIVGWMVLEHLHDPVGGLIKLREWAKPGAWLALSIPNSASLDFRLFKDKLYALHLPNHLYHFTPETLRQVLQAGGWKLEKVHQQRVLNNLIGSIGNVLRDKGFSCLGQKLINFPERLGYWVYVHYPLAWVLSLFGQTGRMTVWARRLDD